MKKLMTYTSVWLVLGFWFIILFVVAGNAQTEKREETPSVEGVWVLTSVSSNPVSEAVGDKLEIRREDSRYRVIGFTPSGQSISPDVPGGWKAGNFAYGNESEIVHTEPFTYDRLKSEFSPNPPPDSVLGELAGKNLELKLTYKLIDNNTLLLTKTRLNVSYSTDGSLGSYELDDTYFKTTYSRVSPAASEHAPASSAVAQVESRGEFYFLTKDGRKVTGEEASKVPLEEGSKVVTGSTGHVRMILPDNTTFTVGPNSDLVIDKFVYDPATDSQAITANLSKGVFRWVTGKTAHKDPAQMKVTLPVGDLGIRGTDFEATVESNGNGSVVLYFGQLEITEKKTGFKFLLEAGQKVTFGSDGSFNRPMKVQ
jgi:hypothetical protein